MRVVFSNYDAPDNPYYAGGGAQAIHEVGQRLAQRHEVTVVCGAFPGAKDRKVDQVQYLYVGTRRPWPRFGQIVFWAHLPRLVRTMAYDVWVESLTPPFSSAWLPLFTRRPVVFLTQVLAGEGMWRKYRMPVHLLERVALRTYRYGIATSRYLAERIRRWNPRCKIVVIPNGISPRWLERAERLEQMGPGRPEALIYVGRIDVGQKGLDILLDAFGKLRGQFEVPLWIAGSGTAKEEAWLRRRLEEPDVRGRVQWLGRIDEEQRAELFRRGIALLLPSRFEASPLIIPEAFAFGLPVVLSRIPELMEYPDDACLKVEPESASALAEAMIRLIQNPAYREQLARHAKAHAPVYSWDRLARQYEEFLGKITSRFQEE